MNIQRIGFAALFYGCFILAGFASTSVQVVKLEESYRVWIETTGTHWAPMSPEGPFPKWSECSVFVLKGAGAPTNGTSQYVIGKDAIGWGAHYGSGYINFDEKHRILELRALNQASYRNQSGIYKNCRFEAPAIHSVTNYAGLANYTSNHAIVKITGFLQDNSRCKMDGGIVYLGGYFQVGPKYEFIGWTEIGSDGVVRMSVYDFKVIQ
jgi:hypothetical protein